MPRFKAHFSFRNGVQASSKEVELPLDQDAFITAKLDLEKETAIKYGNDAVELSIIIALEDISEPSINPDCSPIKKGDMVWCHLIRARLDDFNDPILNSMTEEYKPLWESGPTFGFIMVLLSDEIEHETQCLCRFCISKLELCLN